MRIILSALILLCILSCKSSDKENIKDNLLYKDVQNNIYLKRKIDIMSEKNPLYDQERYFDRVDYKDSTYYLKDIVVVKNFHFVNHIKDSINNRVYDIFEDNKHIYKFYYMPPTSPEIKAIDK